jgi:type II secretory pathway component PulJ
MHARREEIAMTKRLSNRRGYALMLVMIFVVLFGAVLGVAWRRVASALRIEHVREVRTQCDKGSIQALAAAMQVLETRLRLGADGVARIDGATAASVSYKKSVDGRWYLVGFTRDNAGGADWTVSVTVASEEPICSALPSSPP